MANNTYDFALIESIIPSKFQKDVKQLIEDYSSLSDEELWNKYNLEECWFSVEEYQEAKKETDQIGFLIINLLVEKGFIIQLDYKDDPEEYLDEVNPYGKSEEKIVSFDLDNDQIYIANIPKYAPCNDVFGVPIVDEPALTETYLTSLKAMKKPQIKKKERTIWQCERNCKVHYPKQTIMLCVLFCIIFISTLVVSILLLMSNDPRSAISITSYIVCVLSVLALAVTAGCFKGHLTWQYAFVRDEYGDVYFLDYTDVSLARDFHYFDEIPKGYLSEPSMHSNVAKAAGLTYFLVFFPKECKRCFNIIRDNKADVRAADSCSKYGYKITSVPEIKKKSYYTFIRFNILKEGKEVEREYLFDNCYEGYDEMVEYLESHFEHDDPAKRNKKQAQIRKLLFIGLACIVVSAILFAVNSKLNVLAINVIAAFGVLAGIGFIAGFFSEKSKR